jgi:hypothetical protein
MAMLLVFLVVQLRRFNEKSSPCGGRELSFNDISVHPKGANLQRVQTAANLGLQSVGGQVLRCCPPHWFWAKKDPSRLGAKGSLQ